MSRPKNRLGKDMLSDGEVLDAIYEWMSKIVFWADTPDGRELAEEVLQFLRDNEEMSDEQGENGKISIH